MPETGDLNISGPRRKFKINDTVILYIVLVLMVLFFSLTSEFFYSTYNIVTMLANLSFMGIIAAVLTIVLVTGEIDFSIGGNIGLTSCLAAFLINRGLDGWLVIIICLFLGLAIGVFNGFLVTVVGVNSIIATIGTMSIWRGLAYTLTDGRSLLADTKIINYLGYGTIAKVPFPIVIFIIIFAVCYIVMNRSKYGRYVYSIGANPMAAFLSGINVKKIKFLNFVFVGITASIGGLILTGLTTVGMPQHGQGLELVIISAIILGGTAISGGRGQILGTLVGILILSVLYNGLTMLNVYFYYVQIAQGAVLVLVVATYEIRGKRRLSH
jgi:ribose transport system permease protein